MQVKNDMKSNNSFILLGILALVVVIASLALVLLPQQVVSAVISGGQQVVGSVATVVFPTESASVRTRQYVL